MTLVCQLFVGLCAVGLFVLCDYGAVRWTEETGYLNWWLLLPAIAGPLGLLAFGFVGQKKVQGLAVASVFINTGTVIGVALVGVLLRGEHPDRVPEDRRGVRPCRHSPHRHGRNIAGASQSVTFTRSRQGKPILP